MIFSCFASKIIDVIKEAIVISYFVYVTVLLKFKTTVLSIGSCQFLAVCRGGKLFGGIISFTKGKIE